MINAFLRDINVLFFKFIFFKEQTKEVEVSTGVVISFHTNFITMNDRVYTIRCVFPEHQFNVAVDVKFNP